MSHPYLHYNPDTRFNIRLPNGVTFEKSVNNPNSRLNRIVQYISNYGPSTRKDMLRNIFNVYNSPSRRRHADGHSSVFWAGMIRVGFIVPRRVGRTVVYDLGPIASVTHHMRNRL